MATKNLRRIMLVTSILAPTVAWSGPPNDGIVDDSFDNGTEIIPFNVQTPNFTLDRAYDAVADDQGRTYVVGTVSTPIGYRIGIARLRADGEVDDTYGDDPNGVVAPDDIGFNLDGVAAAFDPQGNLLVAGTVNVAGNNDFAVCRFDSTGSLLAFSGSDASCVTAAFDLAPGATADVLTDIAVQDDGKIVLVGTATASINPFFVKAAVARLLPNGTLDQDGFGVGGKRHFLPANSTQTLLTSVAIADNGKIVASCVDKVTGFNDGDPCLYRLNGDGSADETFGPNGFRTYISSDGARDSSFDGIALMPRPIPMLVLDQGIVAVGRQERQIGGGVYHGLIAKINSNGTPFNGFDLDGFRADSTGNDMELKDVQLQYDATITVAGTVNLPNSTPQFYASRFRADGSRDLFEFNAPFGFIAVDVLPSTDEDRAQAIVFHPNRMVIVGTSARDQPVGNADYAVAALVRDRIFQDGVESDD